MAADYPLLRLADALYAEPPARFTPRRDALAKELRASDRSLAEAVKALRKPSLSAWVVNLLVRRDAAQLEQVLSVGDALREAQAAMSGEQLRALTRQRRQLTAAVTTRARVLAGEAGMRVTGSVAEQVEDTLTAAMVDERAAAAVRSGLLVGPLAAAGVDDAVVSAAVALPSALGHAATPLEPGDVAGPAAEPGLRVVPDPDADAKALAAARSDLSAAEAQVEAARRASDEASREAADAEARTLQVQGELDELRRRLAELEAAAEEADDELSAAEEARDEAVSALRAAEAARDRAAAQVERVRRRR